jgi:general secretion pathway protein L
MKPVDTLVLFAARSGGIAKWLRLSSNLIVERGEGLEALPPPPLRTVIALPGDMVTLHQVELPDELSPAQAAAAGRLAVADLIADKTTALHVAAGQPSREDGRRWVGLVAMSAVRGWVEDVRTAGLEPDLIVPQPMLLPAPEEGAVCFDLNGLPIYRTKELAFSAEPDIAELVVGEAGLVDEEQFETGLANAIEDAPINLLQGPLEPNRRFVELRQVRKQLPRITMLGLALLLTSLALQLVVATRYTFAADEAEQSAGAVSAQSGSAAEPSVSFSALASALFSAVRAVPNMEISAMTYEGAFGLGATVNAYSDAELGALREQLISNGYQAEMQAPRASDGRRTAELTVRAR